MVTACGKKSHFLWINPLHSERRKYVESLSEIQQPVLCVSFFLKLAVGENPMFAIAVHDKLKEAMFAAA